ncbi:glycosyltransferase [Candidatus Saccharibacteria bacterium]|nr:glycosyltransferase [Candidatus Saccharibacteria bacterium]
MKAPKVSVVMPIYNCERYLADAVDSILSQTFKDWELIICDDGSSDNTYSIAKKYAQKHSKKIKLLRNNQNLKIQKTLNKCLKHARGEYIARMDGDDLTERNRLKLEVEFLDSHVQYALVSSQLAMFDESGIIGRAKFRVGEVVKEDFIRHPAVFCHAAMMIRRSALEAVGGYSIGEEFARVEDIDLWLKLYENGYKGYNLPEVLYHQRNDTDTMARRTKQNYLNEYGIRKRSFRSLGLPKTRYYYVFRPLVVAHLPKRLYARLHRMNLENQ